MSQKIIFFTIIILFIFSNHIISQTQITITQPRLGLTENTLVIEYDILNSQPTDTFKIWMEVTDVHGNNIKATSLSGDFGEKIKGGLNRKIIWDLKQDSIIIEEEIFVEVVAEKNKIPEIKKESIPVETNQISKAELQKESIPVETFPISKVKSVSKGNMVMSSMILPGWGQSKVKERKPYWLMGLMGYGCLAGSITLNRMGVETYDKYLAAEDIDESNTLYNKSVRQDNISEYLAYSTIGIWTINLIWVLATPNKIKEQIVFLKNYNIKIEPGYDPFYKSPLLSLRLSF
jgi:hypothetical protein